MDDIVLTGLLIIACIFLIISFVMMIADADHSINFPPMRKKKDHD